GGDGQVHLLRQVTAVTARVPGGMAGDAAHVAVGVGAGLLAPRRQVAPDHAVARVEAHRLGQVGTGVVAGVAGGDGVDDLRDLPAQVLLDHRSLDDPVAVALEAAAARRGAQPLEVAAAALRVGGVGRGAGGPQRGPPGDGAVAVDALDLDPGPHLPLQLGVAVAVLHEMAVHAVHALLQVNVHQVQGHAV